MTGDTCTAGWCAEKAWCSITCTATILRRKWHPAIIHTLLEQEPIGFNTLHRSIEDISRKVLSESLSDLESNGIVNRETVDTNPARVQYTLTETGRSLKSVIDAMEEWGASHLDELPT